MIFMNKKLKTIFYILFWPLCIFYALWNILISLNKKYKLVDEKIINELFYVLFWPISMYKMKILLNEK